MKTSISNCLLAVGLLLVTTALPTSADNLIINGDFETGDFTGWTTTPAPINSDFFVALLPPPHDTLGAYFGAYGPDFDSISQTFATTPGAFYDLSFFYQIDEPGSPPNNGFRVLFNNVVIYENLNSISGFSTFTFNNLQATGNMTTLEFQGRNVRSFDFLDDVSVTPTQSQITPGSTTCSQFSSGTAQMLDSLQYSVKNGVIKQINPGVFFYWMRVTASVGSNTFTIMQTPTPDFTCFGLQNGSNVFDSNCVSVHPSITQNGCTINVTFNAPTAGTYFIGIKYDTGDVVGQAAPNPSTVHYDFMTTGVPDSTSGLDLVLKH